MRRCSCDYRYLLLFAVVPFIYIQMRLFTTQSEYADRLTEAIEAETQCTRQSRLLIDQISMQQGRILSLEEEKKRKDEECRQLRALVQDLEGKGLKKLVGEVQAPVAAVVVMACNRADYLERTIKYQTPVASRYPLFISQDGSDAHVKSKALSYDQLTYMQSSNAMLVSTSASGLWTCAYGKTGELIAYYKIARHYKWALDQLFYKHKFSRVIILEDDMEIAPDLFDYFEAGAALLDRDKSIMAISSSNDSGQRQFVHDPHVLYRSDFSLVLGGCFQDPHGMSYLLNGPRHYWDDWLRLKENHKGRQFLHPEVCRTYNFGEHGSSMGHFFKQYLEPIKLNDVQVACNHLANAPPSSMDLSPGGDQWDFERVARQFGIFEEWKDGIPRTAYKGVVVFRYQTQKRIFLIGPDSLQQLGIK